MLIGFLRNLQFCHVLQSNILQQFKTNISSSIPLPSDELLFFPSLIKTEPLTDIKIENGLGWCLWCPDPNQFLSTRFLHLLLFSLSYIFCLPRCRNAGEIEESDQQIFIVISSLWCMRLISLFKINLPVSHSNYIACVILCFTVLIN